MWNIPKKFDKVAKDRVVCLIEDRFIAENPSTQEACTIVASKLGSLGTLPGNRRKQLDAKDAFLNAYRKA